MTEIILPQRPYRAIVGAARRSFLLGALALGLLTSGCAHYTITLTSGDVIRTRSKPKLNAQGLYVFKDATGRKVALRPMHVRQIEPARWGASPKPSQPFQTPSR